MPYNITYISKDDNVIDETQIDENDEQLIWDLFKDFGHVKLDGTYYEIEEVEENE